MRLLITIPAICIGTLNFNPAVAQREGVDAQQNLNALGGIGSNTVRTFDTRYEGIRGNPFFLPYWSNAQVVFKDGRSFSRVPLKFDAYQNLVVIRRPPGDSVILNSALISHFSIQDVAASKDYLFKRYADLKTDQVKLKDRFFQVIREGKTSLLVSRDKSIIKANFQGAYSAGRTYDELVDETKYYLLKPGGTLVNVRLNRKSILEHFPEHQAEIKAYAQKENVDFKDEDAVGGLVGYANSLD